MTRLLVIAIALTLSACNLGKLFGSSAVCSGDSNCPVGEVCCGGTCAPDCDTTQLSVLTATLLTDYVPGYDFDSVVIRLDDEERAFVVNPLSELLSPRAVAQFTDVSNSSHRVSMTLRLEGAEVGRYADEIEVDGDVTVDVVLPRLGEFSCSTVADCVATGCATPACIGGQCFAQRNDDACASAERCVGECRPLATECDNDLQCDDAASCTSERCRNGRCVATPIEGGCSASAECNPSALTADRSSGCTAAPCEGRPRGFVCRQRRGLCDVAETCDGSSPLCPPDAIAAAGAVCRESRGDCDPAELCDGVDRACPDNVRSTAVCRASRGACDPVESCNGVSAACPPDVLINDGALVTNLGDCRYTACTGAFTPSIVNRPDGGGCENEISCGVCSGGVCTDPCTPNSLYCAAPGSGAAGCLAP